MNVLFVRSPFFQQNLQEGQNLRKFCGRKKFTPQPNALKIVCKLEQSARSVILKLL